MNFAALMELLSIVSAVKGVPPIVGQVLTIASELISRGEEGAAELAALTDKVRAMVAADRDPTTEELADLKAQSDAASAIIEAAGAKAAAQLKD